MGLILGPPIRRTEPILSKARSQARERSVGRTVRYYGRGVELSMTVLSKHSIVSPLLPPRTFNVMTRQGLNAMTMNSETHSSSPRFVYQTCKFAAYTNELSSQMLHFKASNRISHELEFMHFSRTQRLCRRREDTDLGIPDRTRRLSSFSDHSETMKSFRHVSIKDEVDQSFCFAAVHVGVIVQLKHG